MKFLKNFGFAFLVVAVGMSAIIGAFFGLVYGAVYLFGPLGFLPVVIIIGASCFAYGFASSEHAK